jgi:uncharacterized protein
MNLAATVGKPVAVWFANPQLIVVPINDQFSVAANPLVSEGVQVINALQERVLKACYEGMTATQIALHCGLSVENVETALRRLAKQELVSTGEFSQPTFRDPKQLSLWLHTTDRCTLRCTYCHVCHGDQEMPGSVIERLEQVLLRAVQEQGIKSVKLRVAGGEPFLMLKKLKNELLHLRNVLQQAGCQFGLNFLTNLTVFTPEVLEFIQDFNVGLGVSMDGTKESHDKTRIFPNGTGSYDMTVERVDQLLEMGIRPYIMIVCSNQNLEDLVAFTRDFLLPRKLGFRYSIVRGEDLDEQRLVEVLKQCYALIEAHIEAGNKVFPQHRLFDLNFGYPILNGCGAARSSYSLYVNGDVYTCQTVHHTHEPIGNIMTEDRSLIQMGQEQTALPGLKLVRCDDCQFRYMCAGGCPSVKIDGRSPHCETFKQLMPVVLRLIGKQKLVQWQLRQASRKPNTQ